MLMLMMVRHRPLGFTRTLIWVGGAARSSLQNVPLTNAFFVSRRRCNFPPRHQWTVAADDFSRSAVAPASIELRAAFPTSASEEAFIRDNLMSHELFAHFPEGSLAALVSGFDKVAAARNQTIVTQGDSCEGDYVYMIAEGECQIEVNGKIIPPPFGRIEAGSIFGELGFLYGKDRAATVLAQSDPTVLFRIEGEAFKRIMDTSTNDLDMALMREIDECINQVTGTMAIYDGDIVPTYRPERFWLWRQLSGTVIKISAPSVIANCAFCLVVVVLAGQMSGVDADYQHIGNFFFAGDGAAVLPDADSPLAMDLSLIHKIWRYQQTLTTFVLTFFVNRAFGFWQSVYADCRKIQTGLDGFSLLLSANVKRDEDGTYPPEAAALLEDVGQYSRLFHVFYWASVAERFRVLLTPEGIVRMESRGMMDRAQLEALEGLDVSSKRLYLAPLEWMAVRTLQAMERDIIYGDTALKGQILKKTTAMRESCLSITNRLAGRMPLSYTQLVQILVDSFVLLAPIALYSELGGFSVFAVGFITMFYTGLLNLAKIFLDPLNNQNFCEEDANFMDLAVLIRESNGASTRWKRVGERLPFQRE